MMDWFMTEDREQLVEISREFAQRELRPIAVEALKNDAYDLAPLMKRAADLGILGAWYPECYGGLGLGWTSFCLANEEISKEFGVFSLNMGCSVTLAGGIIFFGGTEEQKMKWLPKIASGEYIFAGSHTEPCGMMNSPEMTTIAVLDGDEWVINGSKIFTTGAGYATHLCVNCVTSSFDPATMTGTTYIVVPTDAPGVAIAAPEHKMGWAGSCTCGVTLENVRVPKENMIGAEPGHSVMQVMPVMVCENLIVGVSDLADAEVLYQKTWDFTHERIQCGRSMYETHQVIRHKLAKMRMEIDTLRGLIYATAAELDKGRMPLVAGNFCKIKGTEVLDLVSKEAIELHGGIGVVPETGIERAYREVRISALAGGSIEVLYDNALLAIDLGMDTVL